MKLIFFNEIEFKIIMHVVVILVLAFHVCEDLHCLYRSYTASLRVVDTKCKPSCIPPSPPLPHFHFDPSQKNEK